MWSLFQSAVNPSVCLLLNAAQKSGNQPCERLVFRLLVGFPGVSPRPGWDRLCPGSAPGLLPSLTSGESRHVAQEQQFWLTGPDGSASAVHTFRAGQSESSCCMKTKIRSMSSAVLSLPAWIEWLCPYSPIWQCNSYSSYTIQYVQWFSGAKGATTYSYVVSLLFDSLSKRKWGRKKAKSF